MHIPFHYHGVPVLTLRQIDQINGTAKGTAFRAFKRAESEITEGEDFFVVDRRIAQDPETTSLLMALEAADALYASSQVAILISEKAYARLQAIANLRNQ